MDVFSVKISILGGHEKLWIGINKFCEIRW